MSKPSTLHPSNPKSSRDFRNLMWAGGVSGLGDWMGTFAFMALAFHTSDSAVAVGGILALRLLPAALGSTVVARLVKKLGRRQAMVLTDFVRAGIVAMVPLISQLWWIYLWAFLLEATSIIFLTARDSSIPDVIGKRTLPTANAMVLATSYGAIPISAGLFAGIAALPIDNLWWLGWIGSRELALVFWVDALTFIVSAFFIMRIVGISKPTSAPTTQTSTEKSPDKSTRLLSGFKLPLIKRIMPAVATVSIGLGALFSLGITFIRDELNATNVEYGVMIAIFGVGGILGLAATRKMGDNHLATTRLGTILMGAVVAAMSLSPTLWGTFLGAAGFGLGATIALTAGMSTLQSSLNENERVLAFAIFHLVIRVSLGASALITGILGDTLNNIPLGWDRSLSSTRLILLAAGVLVLLTALFSLSPKPPNTP